MSKLSKSIQTYLQRCEDINDIDPEDPCFDTDITTLSDEALAYSHATLKKYMKVAEASEKDILPEMSDLLTEIRASQKGAITRCRDLIVLMESWLKIKETDKCHVDEKRVLLLSIGFLLKALPLRINQLPFFVRALVPKDLVAKITTLTKGVKKNLKRIETQ